MTDPPPPTSDPAPEPVAPAATARARVPDIGDDPSDDGSPIAEVVADLRVAIRAIDESGGKAGPAPYFGDHEPYDKAWAEARACMFRSSTQLRRARAVMGDLTTRCGILSAYFDTYTRNTERMGWKIHDEGRNTEYIVAGMPRSVLAHHERFEILCAAIHKYIGVLTRNMHAHLDEIEGLVRDTKTM